MKCQRCGKHRIRTKRTVPVGFTWNVMKVRYCIGCGWEKVVEEKPGETESGFVRDGEWVGKTVDR